MQACILSVCKQYERSIGNEATAPDVAGSISAASATLIPPANGMSADWSNIPKDSTLASILQFLLILIVLAHMRFPPYIYNCERGNPI